MLWNRANWVANVLHGVKYKTGGDGVTLCLSMIQLIQTQDENQDQKMR